MSRFLWVPESWLYHLRRCDLPSSSAQPAETGQVRDRTAEHDPLPLARSQPLGRQHQDPGALVPGIDLCVAVDHSQPFQNLAVALRRRLSSPERFLASAGNALASMQPDRPAASTSVATDGQQESPHHSGWGWAGNGYTRDLLGRRCRQKRDSTDQRRLQTDGVSFRTPAQ